MNKLFDYNYDIKERMFYVLAVACVIANTFGFIANFILYGFSLGTMFCGICAMLMIFFSLFGFYGHNMPLATQLIIFTLNLVEFPFLCYTYGNSTILYMLLGLISINLFLEIRQRIVFSICVIIYDSIIVLIGYFYPSHLEIITPSNEFGSTLSTYIIVSITVFVVLTQLLYQYEKQNTELMKVSHELSMSANLDPLTTVFNRRYLTNFLEAASSNDDTYHVALLDLDDFKKVNDKYGHVYGDDVLVNFARILNLYLPPKGIVARYGGEEFMIVFVGCGKADIEQTLYNAKLDYESYSQATQHVTFTFSGGVQAFNKSDHIVKLFSDVDEKLYLAKTSGKNRIEY